MINVCNKLLVQIIVSKNTSVKTFSVLVDKTSDIVGIDQFSLCLCYYDNDIKKIMEDFPTTHKIRQSLIPNSIEKLTPKASGYRLKRLCATR